MALRKAASSLRGSHLLLKYAFCVQMSVLAAVLAGDYTN